MRIAFHLPRASFLKPGESGDRVFVRALRAELERRGHEVRVVSQLNARDIWRGRVSLVRLVREAIAVRKEMKLFSPDAWLVFSPVVSSPDLFGWWLGPRRYVLLSADAGSHGPSMPRAWRWLFSLAHRRSLKRADHLTAERPACAARLRSAGVPDERVSVCPLAVSGWKSIPSRDEARTRLEVREETPLILCIARFSHRKSETVLRLFAAFSGLPPHVTLLVAGDGPARERLEREVRRLGLEHRVRLLGRWGYNDVPWLYAACDLYAYPGDTTDVSSTVLEAQSCGRPVVAMDTSSVRLTIDNGNTGLLARDQKELQAHLAALACDRARCKSMGEAAREYFTSHHSIEVQAGQIERLLA